MQIAKAINELQFKAIRSSGAGGQHVNKTSSKVELTFDLENSDALSEKEKELLKTKLQSKLTKTNVLILFCEETRSQHKNKELAIQRFLSLIKTNLIIPKKRKTTKPSRASLKRKAENKQRNSVKKDLRKRPKLE
ncbi:alternative ribosome rescue aminoacyl-tRNA hydrolase ArfB [Polaribacter sp.]|uniref:alternative ribosome rescue aminoacyl-tRNA hydrolase ArfB n=1 Tax=Polaribacter sp. TaxID=1920175 RepID=UPI0025CE6E2F|nr:alternative ribosome rescue aminoacyl-tRNA hydrolase ArfB [Polaribacter sp.]